MTIDRHPSVMDSTVLRYLQKSVLCWLATIDENGCPNVSPKEIFCASGNGLLLIANIASPGSLKNIQTNPQVCVSFVDVFTQKGFKIKGKASAIRIGDEAFPGFASPLAALAGDRFSFMSLFVIDVQSVEPIVAPSYRLFPDIQEASQINSAMQRYGVQPIPLN